MNCPASRSHSLASSRRREMDGESHLRIRCARRDRRTGWRRSDHADYRGVNPVAFPRTAIGNHFAPSGLHGRLSAGGTNGESSFSEFLSPLSRVALRGSAAAHSSSTPGHRNRGFYRPISRRDPLDAGRDRIARAVGRPTILEMKPSTAGQYLRGGSPVPATRPQPRLAPRAIRHKPW